ncbi:23S rRNA (uracil(1939)-C(5))-methyltransferase RlmD [Clostridium tagluense]|uniref:23S rRNA (uracil(1939)-C(5))-methyltransferase RlmD n=1 Tax=Clostridium TaxID=1485 RepID=UPI0013E969F3|nr:MULTISPECIES: 23S rRNA (uracil(1939)-C(5))-methyltransferase RlmD [Clostridium]MBU3126950.1 23S rRNA (uracil(1939)-C(5))-methyltransferase RlmD [Clostridium tagluense]MBZ9625389.1 23S rRNA (uracil(1939)-C(5))-methyltransferase RlmD [Clostridium sp. FP2]MCB2313570.1 23S rRNA (uracil(1939)-C(5))-methyltransferase RlmD [Clostridium tagluense]MCB2318434.1 23S rRNA (uracil(1939)-C(5))-methyltransferase RlmD [Clostridium tagluense]MCB2323235.1 23S rRNA (uracil(1939)-C(5))-methyltransferase RlmD [
MKSNKKFDNYIIPVKKNEDYIMTIDNMGYEGEGVGKIDNFTVFVAGAILGEKVKVKIVKISKSFAFGKLLEIIESSSSRIEPVCTIYKNCGGCNLQHIDYTGQLDFKTNRVIQVINRIGKLEDVIVHPTLGMEKPYNYRNKVQLPVSNKNGTIDIGFYAARSHDIINMETCHIQDKVADVVVKLTKQWMKEYNIQSYNEENHKGLLRHIMIRKGFKTGEVMVVLVTNGKNIPYKEEFIATMTKKIQGLVSVVQNINSEKTNVILGAKCVTLWGKDTITDYIGEFKFEVSPLSFFQVNSIQTEKLYSKALEYANLSGGEVVLDAYCGTGTISLFLSQKAKKVYGVEIVPEAIENAIINAKENKVNNTEFIVGEAENAIPKLISLGVQADVVVVDPPRKGCDKTLLEAISSMGPRTIVYVSCDPGTLARDLGILDELGYKTLEIQPVDMFPQTAHVECVARIEKK